MSVTLPNQNVAGCLSAQDLGAGKTTARAQDTGGSGVASVVFKIYDTLAPSTAVGGSSIPGGQINGNSVDGNWTNNNAFPTGAMTSGDQYFITATGTDVASNVGTSPSPPTILPFKYSANGCFAPYLQTTGGDVHTNGNLNAPGGP
jgi:hypothetical protein